MNRRDFLGKGVSVLGTALVPGAKHIMLKDEILSLKEKTGKLTADLVYWKERCYDAEKLAYWRHQQEVATLWRAWRAEKEIEDLKNSRDLWQDHANRVHDWWMQRHVWWHKRWATAERDKAKLKEEHMALFEKYTALVLRSSPPLRDFWPVEVGNDPEEIPRSN